MQQHPELVVEWQEFVAGGGQGEGHYIGTDQQGNLIQAHFVNVGHPGNVGRRRSSRGGIPKHAVLAEDTIEFESANLTNRNWRKRRATVNEREHILRVGQRLEDLGTSAMEVAKIFNLLPRTYSAWKKNAGSRDRAPL